MPATMIDSAIFGSLWSQHTIKALFDDVARTRAWLEIVAVLAEVQAEFTLIPAPAAHAIALRCRELAIDAAFLEEMRIGREASGHSMQGMIRAVQSRLTPADAQWVYAGATVQDVTDTWMMLVLRTARQQIERDLERVDQAMAVLALRYRDTPMAGRTHGQQGLPITFGFKVAGWLAEVRRHRQRFVEIAQRMDVVQLAGGVGSLSSLGPHALELQRSFAQRVGLGVPLVSWTNSRDVFAEWGALLTLVTGTADRIGHEVYNLQRSEIGEVREGFKAGTVGSITMPHKRNPEIGEHLGTLARLTRHLSGALAEGLVHDHERDGRAWKTEWIAVPEATMLAARAIELLAELLADLEVDAVRMRANLEAGGGFMLSEAIMLALAPHIGRDAAHLLLYQLAIDARANGRSLVDAVRGEPGITSLLDASALDALLDVASHTGCCAEMVNRVLESP
ncbi:MAG: adenylosuccinate lyase family protein [Burkholderiaceae bacterium]|nr:adenylosuccinate lyase family protein [Rhodoferax sp.]MDO8777380.1 adenylosuccinate lyase family protein [Burkholderiaceae bacterium]